MQNINTLNRGGQYLQKKTWIHRGGYVKNWLEPTNSEELTFCAQYLYQNKCNFKSIGHTSNIYFKNSFNIDYILDTKGVKSFRKSDENTIECDCGMPIKTLSKYCVEHGYAGYEGMINLPGTVAGAIVNNSGCYGCGVEYVLKSIDIVKEDGKVYNIANDELGYSFRNSLLKKGILKGVIIKAYFDISKREDPKILKEIAERNHQDRIANQDPPTQNLGSAVNPSGNYQGLRGLILRIVRRVLMIIKLNDATINKILPNIVCLIYLCPSVSKYISKKRMSCFIWKDENADEAFSKYIRMIKKLYQSCSTEIEILE